MAPHAAHNRRWHGMASKMSRILRAFLANETALKRFLARFFPHGQQAEDMAQETFLRAFAAEARQDVLSPKAFLFRTARNLALNERAKWSHSMTDSIEDFGAPDVLGSGDRASIDEELEGRQKLALFRQAVLSLPPQCRRVFVLRKVHGWSQKEIAQSTGISVSTVEKHVAAGLLKCSEYLSRHGYGVDVRQAGAAPGQATEPTGCAVSLSKARGHSRKAER